MTLLSTDVLGGELLDYAIVDVFTPSDGRAFAGNPLAVVLDGHRLSGAQCQALALEFHLSETVFPLPPTGDHADYRVRIFTPSSELPFAGHPSIGAAWTLAQLGRLPFGAVRQECGAGVVTLELPEDGGPVALTGIPPTMSEPVDPAPLLAATGLSAADLGATPARFGGSGIAFAFLPVRREALERARPDLGALPSLGPELTGVLLAAVDAANGELRIDARMFAADIGGEDPATGSAALGLGGWLVANGLAAPDGTTRYRISQGVQMGRPSELVGDVLADGGRVGRVRVAGRVAAVATGQIRVPT